MKKSISLVGLMGSGKSTLSELLARYLGYQLLDTDRWIAQKTGLLVHEIIENFGWEFFRQKEIELCNSVEVNSQFVIATGGGFVMHEDNFQWLLRTTTVVYLHISPEIAVDRTKFHSFERPLLDSLSMEERRFFLSNQYIERDPVYSRANYRLNGECSVKEVLNDLIEIASKSEVK